ncbi:MAG: 4,5-dioxygenase [Gammaproteobacteria bacterium]|nr:MAG: 4,5-dioxygenase [Gammaproteobacteria bacterium]
MADLVDQIKGYHAHVYFEPSSRVAAEQVRQQLGELFDVQLGRWKEGPVGPHSRAMYQVAFEPAEFDRLIRWLMLNRRGLDILVHPDSGLGHAGDHTIRALWFGNPLPLNIELLQQIDREHGLPEATDQANN